MSSLTDGIKPNKQHRKSTRGAKFNKKNPKKKTHDIHNVKAFGVAKAGRAKRTLQRTIDRNHRAEHAPLIERKGTVPAPTVVVVMGPPKVGKTT